ncbi:uncharacterized protein B0I36DRAFT_353600 [Microdochium trichocladiopsis]|uniref:DUF7730 domain-containing protein n=1 Tax=Microdochium trichocladiopsis TaxID=1682393 RepID=A0A9P9BHT0_9PEZI|nr:uncharacterized protein B0I36DRAFT_353600 [Microdochium trichocladiopsis]KAH7020860.1 hypothetical protein B0I36DRAFT_353600 [Microdochium trichocladiopsis]
MPSFTIPITSRESSPESGDEEENHDRPRHDEESETDTSDDDEDDEDVTPTIMDGMDDSSSEGSLESEDRIDAAAQALQVYQDNNAQRGAHFHGACPAGQKLYDAIKAEELSLVGLFARLRVRQLNLNQTNGNLRTENDELREKIKRLEKKPEPPTPWYELLHEYITNPHCSREKYPKIYTLCCRQENMSKKLWATHPDLKLVDKVLSDGELRFQYETATEGQSSSSGSSRSPLWAVFGRRPPSAVPRHLSTVAFPQRFTRTQPLQLLCAPKKHFAFAKLPPEVQAKIFRISLVKENLIHCLSRLDRKNAPPNFPAERRPRHTELPNRFHVGGEPCCVSTASKPNDVLMILLVCKRWCYLGVHAFYGNNTFAFSSLGELGRFCRGIGPARLARIRNMELFWHGSLMAAKPQVIKDDPHSRRHRVWKTNQRTLPLKSLLIALRLETLAVHIQEADEDRMRREYEMKYVKDRETDYHKEDIMQQDVFGAMCHRTEYHANYRKYRSLRTCHGMDYIYQLRGLRWVRFYEFNGVKNRQPVRDYTFVEDINSVITKPKAEKHAIKSLLHNLPKIEGLGKWEPSEQDKKVVDELFSISGTQAYADAQRLAEAQAAEEEENGSDIDIEDDVDDPLAPTAPPVPSGSPAGSFLYADMVIPDEDDVEAPSESGEGNVHSHGDDLSDTDSDSSDSESGHGPEHGFEHAFNPVQPPPGTGGVPANMKSETSAHECEPMDLGMIDLTANDDNVSRSSKTSTSLFVRSDRSEQEITPANESDVNRNPNIKLESSSSSSKSSEESEGLFVSRDDDNNNYPEIAMTTPPFGSSTIQFPTRFQHPMSNGSRAGSVRSNSSSSSKRKALHESGNTRDNAISLLDDDDSNDEGDDDVILVKRRRSQ